MKRAAALALALSLTSVTGSCLAPGRDDSGDLDAVQDRRLEAGETLLLVASPPFPVREVRDLSRADRYRDRNGRQKTETFRRSHAPSGERER